MGKRRKGTNTRSGLARRERREENVRPGEPNLARDLGPPSIKAFGIILEAIKHKVCGNIVACWPF